MSQVVLGIHSNVRSDSRDSRNGELVPFDAGHGWISVTRDGVTTNYGLWPDFSRAGDNGKGNDIRIGMENEEHPAASRYYRLSDAQAQALEKKLSEDVTWGYTENCSSWASDSLKVATGIDIDANERWSAGIVETPRKLGDSIKAMEQRDRSSLDLPAVAPERGRSMVDSSFELFSSDGKPSDLSPAARQLIENASQQVHELAEKNHLQWNQGLTNTVAAVAADARAHGLTGITHLAVQDGEIRYAQMNGATLRDGHLNALDAANTPAAQSMQELKQNDQAALAKEHGKVAEGRTPEGAHAMDAPVLAGP